MKTEIIFLTLLLIMGSSCEYQVDNTDVFKVGSAIHESFAKNDSSILKKVFIHKMDSIKPYQKERIEEIKGFYSEDLKIMKMDTSSSLWGQSKMLDIYYKKQSDFYRVRAFYVKDSIGHILVNNLYFNDIKALCEGDKNTPYSPKYGIEFKSLSWTTDYYEKTFRSGKIALENNTGSDLTYIKFKVILQNGSYSWNAETFLNQTVESYKPIYEGDIATIEIPGMTDYFTGFKIHKDRLFFTAELIEVLPKPESSWCIMLEELKDEVIRTSSM